MIKIQETDTVPPYWCAWRMPPNDQRFGEGGTRLRQDGENTPRPDCPLVSVITVVYNGERFLASCIDSVIAQKYPRVEQIVIDGGSTDGSVDILRECDNKLAYWISEPDQGLYDAMNKGIRLAQGEILGILNADDWYEVDCINKVVETFDADDTLEVVYGAMRIVDSHGVPVKTIRSREKRADIFSAPFNHPATFARRRVYEKYGLFREEIKMASDYDFMLRVKKAGVKYGYVDQILTNFRLGGVSSASLAFPVSQIWKSLRGNGICAVVGIVAIGYRCVRMPLVWLRDQIGLRRDA